jgi:hypothetical protein
MEMISHLFGACGENHPSLIYMIGLGQLFITIKDYTIIGYNIFLNFIKNGLKRLSI